MALLRQQQLRLAIIKAIKLFFANQNVLRHILKQSAIHLEEDKKDVNLLQRFVYIYYQVVYLQIYQLFVTFLHRLLSKATHPSPLKAIFSVEELEAACLAVCQYLASAGLFTFLFDVCLHLFSFYSFLLIFQPRLNEWQPQMTPVRSMTTTLWFSSRFV